MTIDLAALRASASHDDPPTGGMVVKCRTMLAILDRLAAADVVVDVARICDWTDPEDECAVMGRAIAAYDRAIAGQQPREEGT